MVKVCGHLVTTHAYIANAKGIELDFDRPEREMVMTSNMNGCKLVINNLLDNAIKFTERG